MVDGIVFGSAVTAANVDNIDFNDMAYVFDGTTNQADSVVGSTDDFLAVHYVAN